jgi:TM2 domain-containing membrane protein YozV
MNTIWLGIITLAVVFLVIFIIYLIIGVRKTLAKVDEFIDATEENLMPTLRHVL